MQELCNHPSDNGNPDNIPMGREVGTRLRHARKLKGLTQQVLAKSSGVKQATISELETGESKSPVGTNLIKLAQSLQVSPEWLATGKGSMEQQTEQISPEALTVAREWQSLAPEIRDSLANTIHQLHLAASSYGQAVSDKRVEEAYGRPGQKAKSRK